MFQVSMETMEVIVTALNTSSRCALSRDALILQTLRERLVNEGHIEKVNLYDCAVCTGEECLKRR